MSTQLVILVVAIVALAGLVALLRRAAKRSQERTTRAVQERLGVEQDQPARRRRERVAPRPGGSRKPASAGTAAAPAKPAEPATPVDAEARAAYQAGLAKTRGGFVTKLGKLFGKKQIADDLLEELEAVLFTADIGPRAADRIFQSVKKGLSKDDLTDGHKVWARIRQTSTEILQVESRPVDVTAHKPWVLLTIGVNGVGKTTTIGKLAARFTREGKKVILGAGDTFRAAAAEQLEEWGKRAGVPVVRGKAGADPSAVIFEAIKRGVDEGADVVICDTAGRLHSNSGLMDELAKVRRVCDKACPGAPHDTWMVLDSTTGQNAIAQAKTFKEIMEITGIVMTKLDGSSKGGVILGICDELKVPVRFVGIGEQVDDLRPFDPAVFVDALYAGAEPVADDAA
jgi:fused signal recognition particle receptor